MKHNKKINIAILCLFIVFCAVSSKAQFVVSIKFIGLTTHIKKSPHPQLYKRKLNKNGYFVINSGIIIGVEYIVVKPWFGVKVAQAIFSDCANQKAGFTHFGFRLHGTHNKHEFTIGNGPTLFYRKDWSHLSGYVDEDLFKYKNGHQYRYFWLAGEVEYNYHINNEFVFSTTFIPGPPEFTTIAPGVIFK